MRKKLTAISIAILLYATINSHAQTEGAGSWSVANIRYGITKKWLVWSEFQLRSYRFYNHFYYHEIKGGFQYNLTNKISFLMGTGRYRTYTPGGNFRSPLTADETRLWEQFTLTNDPTPLLIEHRYRIEQRWLKSGYRNRYRYRLSLLMPINQKKLGPHALFATGFDELFLTNQAPHFERNRVFGGLGYQLSKIFTVQLGYLNQFDYRANGTSVTNHYVQTSLFVNFAKADFKRIFHPSTED